MVNLISLVLSRNTFWRRRTFRAVTWGEFYWKRSRDYSQTVVLVVVFSSNREHWQVYCRGLKMICEVLDVYLSHPLPETPGKSVFLDQSADTTCRAGLVLWYLAINQGSNIHWELRQAGAESKNQANKQPKPKSIRREPEKGGEKEKRGITWNRHEDTRGRYSSCNVYKKLTRQRGTNRSRNTWTGPR